MRIKVYAVAVFAVLLLPAASAFGQDLSMRRALYFTGSKTDKIDLKNDKYVAADGSITVSPLIATKCEAGGCYFNLGFIAFRNPAGGAQSASVVIEGTAGWGSGKTLSFASNEATKQSTLNVKLATGAQTVTFKIDPYKKIAESNENNNSFSVTVIVEGKP